MKYAIQYLAIVPCILVLSCSPVLSYPGVYIPSQPVQSQTAARSQPRAPELKALKNGHYKVKKPWKLRLNKRTWHIPAGYKSNGITAPSKLKKSMGDGPDHPETWAAVFHDWLFTQPGISRAKADQLFYDLLIAYGVPQTKAHLMYSGVSAYSATKAIR